MLARTSSHRLREEAPCGRLHASYFCCRVASRRRCAILRTKGVGLDIDVHTLAEQAVSVEVLWPRLYLPVHAFEEFDLVDGDTAARGLRPWRSSRRWPIPSLVIGNASEPSRMRAERWRARVGRLDRCLWGRGERDGNTWVAPFEHDPGRSSSWRDGVGDYRRAFPGASGPDSPERVI